jgi:hypothetical protein
VFDLSRAEELRPDYSLPSNGELALEILLD